MRRSLALIVGLGLLLGVTACAGGPGAAIRPTGTDRPASASAIPTPTTPGVEPISSIIILADGVRFQAGETVRETLAYDSPIDVALAAFADALGPETGSKEYPATNHTEPVTAHQFGDEVRIVEPHYGAGVENDPMVRPVWWIRTDTAESGGVRISTAGGITVGSSVEDIPGWNDPDRMGTLTANGTTMAELLVVAAPGSRLVPDADGGAYGVLALADAYPGPITTLVAPSQHGGA